LNILIFDDDMDIPDILAEILASRGHRVRVAHDGRQGLKMLHEELPDAVILDVEMPKLTGPEMVYRMIIEDLGMQNIPVVLVSGIVGLTDIARRAGTPYFMEKPFDLDRLLAILQNALAEKRPPVPAWTP
jgi:DNA-binding NtrC family response regulator